MLFQARDAEQEEELVGELFQVGAEPAVAAEPAAAEEHAGAEVRRARGRHALRHRGISAFIGSHLSASGPSDPC